jgi:MFS family permease
MLVPLHAGAAALTGLAALGVAMGIGRFAFTPILPMMVEERGLTLAQGGWLAAANYAGYLAGALSAIGLKLQPATAIRAGMIAISLSTLGMGLEQGLLSWVALRAAAGLGSAWVLVFVSTWSLERLARAGRPDLAGTVYGGVGVGILFAGCACLALMAAKATSRDAWLVLGLAALAVSVLLWPYLDAPSGGSAARASSPRPAASSPGMWRLVLCYGAFGFAYIIPATFLPVMGKQASVDAVMFGWAWPAFGAAAAASTLLAGLLSGRLAHRTLWTGASLVMALGTATPLLLPGLAGVVAAALCVGGTFMVITMAAMEEARRVAGARAQALMAGMTSAFAAGQVVGPIAASTLVRVAGDLDTAMLAACATLVLGAGVLRIDPKEGRS